MFSNPTATFSTTSHKLHRQRRGAIHPFFSKRKVSTYAPAIQRKLDRVCERVATEYAGPGEILTLNDMWSCWTSDIIVDYCFERNYNFIERPRFRALFPDAMIGLFAPVHYLTQFPWIPKVLNFVPDAVVTFLHPSMGSFLQFCNVSQSRSAA